MCILLCVYVFFPMFFAYLPQQVADPLNIPQSLPLQGGNRKKVGLMTHSFFFYDGWICWHVIKEEKVLGKHCKTDAYWEICKIHFPPPFRQIHKYTVTATTIVSKCVWQTVWRVKKIIMLFANRQSIKKKVFLWLREFVWQHSDILVNTRVWGWPVAISL